MTDWIHCNGCIRQPSASTDVPFFLTSCGHIFCKKCIDRGFTEPLCRVCSQKTALVEINRQLKADVQLFFKDVKDVVVKQQKRLVQVIQFQDGHRKRLHDHMIQQQKKVPKMMQYFQTEMSKKSELERQNNALQAELKRLQEENRAAKNQIFQLTAGQQRTPPAINHYRSRRHLHSGGRTPASLLLSFEPESTSTPIECASTNVTNLANGLRVCEGGERMEGAESRDNSRQSIQSEITTPKMLGINSHNTNSRDPYQHMWSGGGARTAPRSNGGSQPQHTSRDPRTIARTSPATFLSSGSSGLGFSFTNSNALPRS